MSNVLRAFCVAALFMTLSPFALAQQRSDAPDHQFSAKDVPSSTEVLSTRGGAMVFTDRSAFEAECGVLSTEDFEEANVADNDLAVVGAPLPPEDGVVFPIGSIESGLTIDVTTSTGLGDDLFVSGAGFFGAPSIQLGNNSSANDLFHQFSPSVDCAGYDVDLNNTGTATTIEARDGNGMVLGSASISGFDLQFVGFKSDTPIAEIAALASVSVEFVDTDNVSFGNVAGGDPFTIDANPEAQSAPRGGQANFTYQVCNNTANAQSGVVFFEAFLGQNSVAGPTVVQSGTLQGNSCSPNLSFSVGIPNAAPLATYSVEISAGPSNGNAVATDAVDVTVTAARAAGTTNNEWSVVDAQAWPALEAAARTSEIGAYPNPFADRTEIAYTLEEGAKVQLTVYDVLGREVAVLTDELMEAGTHTATFDARGLATGTYIYRLVAGNEVQSGRITLMK